MPQSAYRSTSVVISGYLYTDDMLTTGILLDTPAWFTWLSFGYTFYYQARVGAFTARRERRRHRYFWYAFRRVHGKLRKAYLGPAARLTRETLDRAAAQLAL
jgi:LuxR family maltose regulon positive regulatory protein